MLRDWSASICLGSSGEEDGGALVVGEVGEDVGAGVGVGDDAGVLGVVGLVALRVVEAEMTVAERRKRR
ncbi:hypothetical protein GQ457_03G036250 [Hibiscus cannabinus]